METGEYKKLIRLYVPQPGFSAGQSLELSEGQAHYLRNVMRKNVGDPVRVFNGEDGDWAAVIEDIKKNKAFVSLSQQISEQKKSPDIWIAASPIKKEPFDLMVEKSCELGAARFIPVICDHTVVHKANQERLQAIAIEAAEQCERGDLMVVDGISNLKSFLNSVSSERNIIFCLEREGAPPFAETVKALASKPVVILIGPEGGFSDAEVAFIKALPRVHTVSLGERVLRAETALIAALAAFQLLP